MQPHAAVRARQHLEAGLHQLPFAGCRQRARLHVAGCVALAGLHRALQLAQARRAVSCICARRLALCYFRLRPRKVHHVALVQPDLVAIRPHQQRRRRLHTQHAAVFVAQERIAHHPLARQAGCIPRYKVHIALPAQASVFRIRHARQVRHLQSRAARCAHQLFIQPQEARKRAAGKKHNAWPHGLQVGVIGNRRHQRQLPQPAHICHRQLVHYVQHRQLPAAHAHRQSGVYIQHKQLPEGRRCDRLQLFARQRRAIHALRCARQQPNRQARCFVKHHLQRRHYAQLLVVRPVKRHRLRPQQLLLGARQQRCQRGRRAAQWCFWYRCAVCHRQPGGVNVQLWLRRQQHGCRVLRCQRFQCAGSHQQRRLHPAHADAIGQRAAQQRLRCLQVFAQHGLRLRCLHCCLQRCTCIRAAQRLQRRCAAQCRSRHHAQQLRARAAQHFRRQQAHRQP